MADGMTGQDAVSAASAFYEQVRFTGVVLTRLDSDTRGGAALSIREVTGVPIKFVGVSEKVDGLEPFSPRPDGVPHPGDGGYRYPGGEGAGGGGGRNRPGRSRRSCTPRHLRLTTFWSRSHRSGRWGLWTSFWR